MIAKVEWEPGEWNARIEALRNVALEALAVFKRKDVKELWDVGENLDTACEACHRSYWYPGEGAEFYRNLRRRLEQFREPPSRGATAAKPQKQGGSPHHARIGAGARRLGCRRARGGGRGGTAT